MTAQPTGKKHFKALQKRLSKLGYEYSYQSGGGSMWVFTHAQLPELTVAPGCSENAARQIIRQVEKSLGVLKKAPKRNAAAVKERQAAERERQAAEIERLQAERDEIIRQRNAMLSGAGGALTNAEIRALEDRVREIEIERRRIEQLMAAPVSGVHDTSRTARHQAGSRA